MNKIITTLLFTFSSVFLFGQFGMENIIFQNELDDPASVQLADFDEDGDLDIIAAVQESDQVIWYRNEGQGQFSDFMVLKDNANGVTRAFPVDVDNDGDLDLITVREDFSPNKLGWYENTDGQGTFSSENQIEASVNAYTTVVIKDLDGDGDMDIVSNRVGWQLYAYFNVDGLGDFSQKIYLNDLSGSASINGIDANDLDGDGDTDIVFTRGNQSEVSWFENMDGMGTFSDKKVAYSGSGNDYKKLVSNDMDGDGDNDILFSTLNGSPKIGWLENLDGLGNFSDELSISEESFPYLLFLEDLDLDGDLDILTTSDFNLVWFENTNGQGLYSSPITIPLPMQNADFIATGDLDGDGDLDLATHSLIDDEIAWMENDGTTNFTIKHTLFTGIDGGTEVHAYDFDGDNDLDILFSSTFNGKIIWQENIDGEANILKTHVITTTANDVRNIAADDLDGDGDLDVYAASYNLGGEKITWYKNMDGLGTFSEEIIIANDLFRTISVHAADVDGDGDLDMFGGAWLTDGLVIYKNTDGLGNFDTGTEISSISEGVTSIRTFDIDGDNDLDVVASFYWSDEIIWYENTTGDGDFDTGTVISSTADGAQFVYPADLDTDGDLDLLAANSAGNEIVWFKNLDGVGTFSAAQIISTGVDNPKSAIGVDLDGDGDLDILSASTFDDNINWFENIDGLGNFGTPNSIDNNFDGAYYAIGEDIDSDGDPDILAAALNSDKISTYENFIDNSLIKGQVFWDENENGVLDTMEIGLNQQIVSLQPNTTSWSSGTGLFNFLVTDGNYDLTCMPTSGWEFTTDSTVSVNYSSANGILVQNFGLKAAQPNTAATIDLTSAPTRCGFVVPFWINYDNTGNQSANGIITLNLDDLVNFQNADPMPNQINGNELVWNFEDLAPTYNNRIKLFLEMPDVNSLGETIAMGSSITLTDTNGNNIFTNDHQYESVINCSYDPNDKLVEPNFEDYDNYTLFGDTLVYTIRFQNTGTDTAFNIRIEDQLDFNLDWSTFSPLTGSHSFEVFLNDNGKLKFYFRDILLPDVNTNEAASHGFVKYQILTKDGLSENTIIDNTADIYFDFNPPIMTNTVSNIMVSEYPIDAVIIDPLCFEGVDGSINLNFPLGEFNYVWNNGSTDPNLFGLAAGDYSVTITDENGQVLADSTFTLNAPSEIELMTSSTPATGGNMDGSATVLPSGGIPPYTYVWDTQPVQTTATATNLFPNNYEVTVTDSNGCTQVAAVIVDIIFDTKDLLFDWKYNVTPNPSSGKIQVAFDFSENKNWSIKVYNYIGALLQKIEAPNGGTIREEFWINDLKSGIYLISLEVDQHVQVKKILVISK